MSGTCHCMLPLGAPSDLDFYRAADDPEPAACVRTVVWWGDEPHQRRWDRDGDGLWLQRGWWVERYPARPEDSHKWSLIGRCWSGEEHVVIPERRAGDGWRMGTRVPGNFVIDP